MDIFDKLTQAAEDYKTLWAAFRASEQEAKDVVSATTSHIEAEKISHAERVATLTAQSRDSARPEVIRRLAKQELSRLETHTFGPSDDEISAFNSAVRDAKAALEDFMLLESKLRDLFRESKGKLDDLRKNTLGNGSMDHKLATSWIEGTQKKFDLILKEAGTK